MELTARVIEGIPRGNLRVPRGEFVAVWAAAERLLDECKATGTADWYAGGVAITCRWLAGVVVPSLTGGWEPATSPVLDRAATAHEELIEQECLAAELQLVRRPDGFPGRPGWQESIAATLKWAWRASGVPPLDVGRAAAG